MGSESLPIRKYATEIVSSVTANTTVVVIGETGSGKTTQLSQILLDAGFAAGGQIAVTQPRRVAAVTVAKRVAEERGVALGSEVGYSVRFEDQTSSDTKIKYLTDGMLLRECLEDPSLKKYSVIILDEAHERTLNTDILFGVLKKLVKSRPLPLKLIITSATLDGEKFSMYFDDCPVFNVPGRCFPVDIIHTMEDHMSGYSAAAVDVVMQIHVHQPEGDILVFLTGQAEIDKAISQINEAVRNMPAGECGPLIALPLYASLPPELQVRIFRPSSDGVRRVIVATNVAETSITVEGIVYVVDSGVVKQKHYQPSTGMDSLDIVPISRVGATQRAGRAGRTKPGKCFRLYSKQFYDRKMPTVTLPEIQRTSLANAVLYLKSLRLREVDVLSFDFLDPPDKETLEDALRQLYILDAIDADGDITDAGRRMSILPLDPALARAILAAGDLGCVDEMVSVAAMLSSERVFVAGQGPGDCGSQGSSDARGRGGTGSGGARLKELVAEQAGDHVLLLRLWELWEEGGCNRSMCNDYGLDLRGMNFARDVRRQLQGVVHEGGVLKPAPGRHEDPVSKRARTREEPTSDRGSRHADATTSGTDRSRETDRMPQMQRRPAQGTPQDRTRIAALLQALTIGFANKIARRLQRHNGYRTMGAKGQLAQLHPACASLREDADGLSPEWIIYHELVSTSKPFLRQVCPTRGEYVEPLMKKLLGVDVKRLSRSKQQLPPSDPVDGSSSMGGADGIAAAANAHGLQRKNDDSKVNAARERYLSRKQQQPGRK